jgi:uncharacterized protein
MSSSDSSSRQPVHLLVEIVHPADVLFFLRPIRAMLASGDRVTVASRHKDVAVALLDKHAIPHIPISRQRKGVGGLAVELVEREIALFRLARTVRPDVMAGFGGVAISHVGKMLGIPTLVIYDSDNASLQTRLAWPFVSRLLVPQDYAGNVPVRRTVRLPGTKDLSYFHPAAFTPDRSIAIAEGLDPARANVFIRTVRWGANHDIGKAGWSPEELRALVSTLSHSAKLHVCAEGDVHEVLRPYLWQGDPARVHHLLGHCQAYVGESCTMACEAVTMGVPAIYAGTDFPGYTLGLAERGLLQTVSPSQRGELGHRTLALLHAGDAFRTRHAEWLTECPDWSSVVVANLRTLSG